MENKNEGIAKEIIRKFNGLKLRPEVSADVEKALKSMTSVDKTREVKADQKEEPLDEPLK